MEMLRGKTSLMIDAAALAARRTGYAHTLIDLGTGDGRFVRTLAESQPSWFVIDGQPTRFHPGYNVTAVEAGIAA